MKKMARVAWKMAPKYQKNAKWPKITFRGPIPVPEVAFWGFWGLVCIEKWSLNFDCKLSAIFGTHKMARVTPLRVVHFLSGASPKESKFVSYQMCKLHPLQLREGCKEIMPF